MQAQLRSSAMNNVTSGDTETLRATMVERQIRTFDVTDQGLIARFLAVPREMFAPAEQAALVYSDGEISAPLIAGGQRPMLAPLALARLLQASDIKAMESVLDVAGAAGYTAALIAGLAKRVVALEDDAALTAQAAENFRLLGYQNAKAITGDLTLGAISEGPFDLIIINGAIRTTPTALLAQLADGGRLLCFEPQTMSAAKAFLYEKNGGDISRRFLFCAAARELPVFSPKPVFSF